MGLLYKGFSGIGKGVSYLWNKIPKKVRRSMILLGLALDFSGNPYANKNAEEILNMNDYGLEEVCRNHCNEIMPLGYSTLPEDNVKKQGVKKSLEVRLWEKPLRGRIRDIVDNKYANMINSRSERINQGRTVRRLNINNKHFEKYCREFKVPITLAKAVASVETGGRHWGMRSKKVLGNIILFNTPGKVTRSYMDAFGIMQMTLATAKELGVNPYDLEQNIKGGIKKLAKNLKLFDGDVVAAITAYNSGERGTKRAMRKAKSKNFLKYKRHIKWHEGRNGYVLNVLATKKVIDTYDIWRRR